MADEEDMEELEMGEGEDVYGEEDGELADEDITEENAEEEEELAAAPTEPLGPDSSVRRYGGHGDSIYSVDVSPDGALCATGSGDDTAHVWRLGDCAPLATLPSGSDTVSCVAFNTSGSLLACGSYDSVVRVYSVAAILAAGELAAGGGGGAASSAATTTTTPSSPPVAPLHTLDGPSGDINFLAWHPKGDVLLAGSSDGTAWMWSTPPAASPAATCMQVFAGHAGGVSAGLFTRDGKLVVTAGEDGSVRVWAPKTGACSKVYQLGEAPVTSLATSPSDAAIVAAATMEGVARIINLVSQRIVMSVDHNDREEQEGSVVEARGGGGVSGEEEEDSTSVESTAFCAVQPWLASGATNGSVVISDLSSNTARHRLSMGGGGRNGGVVKLAWLPGSPLLAVATSHGMVRVFDGRDGSVHASLTGHIGIVLDFWTNGKELVSTGDDGVARVYALV